MAQSVGGRPQVNSGRFWFSKRDSRKFNFLVENRTHDTDKKSYSVKVAELKKLTRDAMFSQALPAMNIEFPDQYENWMLIRYPDFDEMCQYILSLEAQIELMKRG